MKELAVLMKLGQAIQKELPVVDLVCPRWKPMRWSKCRKVTFTLDRGAAGSAPPTALGSDNPIKIQEPKSYTEQQRENPCETKDHECCPS